jgi:hypothetical protein
MEDFVPQCQALRDLFDFARRRQTFGENWLI